jgi:sugar lactone lactonase YvrE
MTKSVTLTGIQPQYAIPGGEIAIACEGYRPERHSPDGCYVAGIRCRTVAASTTRILAIVPDEADEGKTFAHLESQGEVSNTHELIVGRELVDDMHIVANPAVDPSDDAIILTRSGSRGQHLPATLFRLEPDGYLDELPEPILNPTGIAFDADGQMFVTNRAQGEVYAVGRDGTSTVHAAGLGIATGIAFDKKGAMFVGDRSGTIYRVSDDAAAEKFATVEQSVAAYHIAFGPDGRLYVTAPGLASHDAVYAIDTDGEVTTFFRGLGRPQGLAFDKAGNLYVAACYKGSHGIVRIAPDGSNATQFVAGNSIVGLCFTREGDMVVATSDRVYSIACGVAGTLLI